MEKYSVLLTTKQADVIRRVLEADDENTVQFFYLLDTISPQTIDKTCGVAPKDMLTKNDGRWVLDAEDEEAVERLRKFIAMVVENDGIVKNSMWGELFSALQPHIDIAQ